MVDVVGIQKANFSNGFLPFREQIDEQASLAFREVRENLSRTVQCGELTPGLIIWSEKCRDFLSLYGLFFSKVEHLQLIDFYLALLNDTERSYPVAAACLETLSALTR